VIYSTHDDTSCVGRRNRALPAMSTAQERTDVVLVPWHDSSLQSCGRIFAEDAGINVSRAGIGIGVRF
jgi:hypothetical protein